MAENYSQYFDEKLNAKDSLLNTMVVENDAFEGLISGIGADNISHGVFGAFDDTTGVEFKTDKANALSFIQSRNFVSGSAGWRLDSDGNFEGQSGTFRGVLKTANSGERITINETSNAMLVYDSTGQIIRIGTSGGYAITVTGNATTANGFSFDSSVAAVFLSWSESENFDSTGLSLAFTHASNSSVGIRIDHDGDSNGYAMLLDITNAARGIYIGNSGSSLPIEIVSSGDNTTPSISITRTASSASPFGIKITMSGTSGTNTCFDLDISSTGAPYLFKHPDSGIIVSAAVGGTQNKKIRVLIGSTTYFIPLNDA